MTGVARLYLDTNTLIFATEEISERSTLLNDLLDTSIRLTNGLLVTSELTLAELLVKPLRAGNTDLVERYELLIRTGDWLDVYPVSRPVLLRAGALRAHTRLKIPDAIHFATAQLADCTHFMTADTDFSPASIPSSRSTGSPAYPVIVVRPDIPTLTTLLESLSP